MIVQYLCMCSFSLFEVSLLQKSLFWSSKHSNILNSDCCHFLIYSVKSILTKIYVNASKLFIIKIFLLYRVLFIKKAQFWLLLFFSTNFCFKCQRFRFFIDSKNPKEIKSKLHLCVYVCLCVTRTIFMSYIICISSVKCVIFASWLLFDFLDC